MGEVSAFGRWEHRFDRTLHGRDDDVEHLLGLVSAGGQRLITLTGDGGVGKSHLAARVARRLASEFGRTACMIDVGEVTGAELALARCADALGRVSTEGDPASWLRSAIVDMEMLLVIDGADLVARDLGDVVDDLLDDCAGVTVLVTSRLPLHRSRERVIHLGPLPSVDRRSPETIAASPAAAMFVDHAETNGRSITRRDLPVVAAICDRLEGWPLAIELAATHVAVPLTTLLDRLSGDPSGAILRHRAADVPQRQRSITQTVSWSFGLLQERQRQLLMQLSCLRSPATFDEWLEAVAGDDGAGSGADPLDPIDAIDDIESLLRLHLVSVDDEQGTTWWRVRDRVRDNLGRRPTDEQFRRADRSLVDFAERTLRDERSVGPIRRARDLVRRETDLEHALARALARADGAAAAPLAHALAIVWLRSGRHAGGHDRLREVAHSGARATMPPGRAAVVDAWLLFFRVLVTPNWEARVALGAQFDALFDAAVASDDYFAAITVCEMSVNAVRRCHHVADAIRHTGIALELARVQGDVRSMAAHGTWLGMAHQVAGDLDTAARVGLDALAAARAAENPGLAAYASMLLAQLPRQIVQAHGVAPTIEQALDHARANDDPIVLVEVLPAAAAAALGRGETAAALRLAVEGVEVARRDAFHDQGLPSLMVLVALAVARGDDVAAAELAGMVSGPLPMIARSVGERAMNGFLATTEIARLRLGTDVYDRHAAHGSSLTWPLAYRVAHDHGQRWLAQDAAAPTSNPLSEREQEVLLLLVAGRSNKQIGHELGISAKTATHHTTSIYRKLGVHSRAEAVNWAFRNGMVGSGVRG